jgi:Uma2 family endonuclease
MVTQLPPSTKQDIIYPSSDGQPMADNTKQFQLIVLIKENSELLFADNPNVFVAGDLLWYSVEGDDGNCKAPDIMIVFGRPKGHRSSYLQWQEDNIPPQVVFEIKSPGNKTKDMIAKYKFYERYGVEEYYLYDPDNIELTGWLRSGDELVEIEEMRGWVSPRMGIRFELSSGELEIYRPDGQKFLSYLELEQQRQLLQQQVEDAEARVEDAEARAEDAEARAEDAEAQLQVLRDLLQQRGINPEQL